MLARVSSIYKRQTCPLVRGGAPQKEDCNCQRVINIWSWAPDVARHQDLLIDWPSIAIWLTLTCKREYSRIHQEDIVQGSSIVDVLTLRVFMCHRYSNLESVMMNCSFDMWNYPINWIIKSGTHYLLSRYQDTRDNMYNRLWGGCGVLFCVGK
jgi:hypothetical protein